MAPFRFLQSAPMKILVIEDEVRLAAYLQKGLTEEGHVVEVVHNGVDGLHLAIEGQFDLVILDSMLPGLDGLSLLAALRQTRSIPVLMLTARGRVEDRVQGLRAGADDYLVKPFSFAELLARVDALAQAGGKGAFGGEFRFQRGDAVLGTVFTGLRRGVSVIVCSASPRRTRTRKSRPSSPA